MLLALLTLPLPVLPVLLALRLKPLRKLKRHQLGGRVLRRSLHQK